MLEVSGLGHVYESEEEGREPALSGIDLEVLPGEFVALLGSNGSGKSTLARHLNGLLLPTQGRVLVDGLDTRDPGLLWEIRRRVGMVFQDPDSQLVASVVEDELAFGPENLGLSRGEILGRVEAVVGRFGLAQIRGSEPHWLSGGQKQRLAIAAALVMEPRYLVLDEPTAMIDPVGRGEVLACLGDLGRSQKLGIVYVTHHMEEVLWADRAVVLDRGRVAWVGPVPELFGGGVELGPFGLRLPPVVELARRLRRAGITIPEVGLSVESLQGALVEQWRSGGG